MTTMNDSLIAQSVFFDDAYYRAQLLSPLPAEMSPASHYLNHGWLQGLDPGPLFSTSRYLRRHKDVRTAGLNPLLHYLQHGIDEGRRAWSSEEVMRWQRPWFSHPEQALAETEKAIATWPQLRRGDRVLVYCHSQGHFVFQQFQHMIVQALTDIGVDAVAADEHFSAQAPEPALSLVLAPHDFFCLDGAPSLTDRRFANAVLINTEQMPSRWFAHILKHLFNAPFVLDMNVQTAASLCRLGIRARFLPMGYLPQNEIFRASPSESTRDIDVLWVGSNSKRRQSWAEQHRDMFGRYKSFVRLVGVVGALSAAHPSAITPMQYTQLARRTKIQLNLHHFNMPYFEWQRIVHYGLLQGNCVLTEISPRVPGLTPGIDYLEAAKEDIPSLLDWLLGSAEGQRKLHEVRCAGQVNARKAYQLGRTLAELFRVGA
jgi:hypothetical protein